MKCERCGDVLTSSNTVIVKYTDDDLSKYYCNNCYMKSIKETILHENLENFLESITVQSSHGEMHQFRIIKQEFLTGETWEAKEIIDGNYRGYDFIKSFSRNTNPFDALKELYKLIKEGIEKKIIKESLEIDEKRYRIKNGVLRGRIEIDELSTKRLPKFIIDGKTFNLQELGEMLADYEGCDFTAEVSE